jgi:acetyl-CoA synthetase
LTTGDFDFGGPILWRPTPELIQQSNQTAFMRRHGIASVADLHKRAADDVAWFWQSMIATLGIRFDPPYTKLLDLSSGLEMPKWCVGGGLNIVASMLDARIGTPADHHTAIKWESEDGTTGTLTYADLRREVDQLSAALRHLGIQPGEVVAVFMPLTPQCVIAMLAIMKIGAIFLPLFSGYGATAVASRLSDSGAVMLITCDGFLRRGHAVPMKPVADEAAAHSPTVRHVLIHRKLGIDVPMQSPRDVWWNDAIAAARNGDTSAHPTSAEDVAMLIYTSGTTGKPKGIVHTHCSFPIKAAADMWLSLDVKPDETVLWVTDMGWMMGPWLVFGTLICGASMMLYDGACDHPGPDRLWSLVPRHNVTMLGISPTLVRALMRHGPGPVQKHSLKSLRKFASTGEPWNPAPWRWLFETAGQSRLPILNYSGGTEIAGGIVTADVLTPQKPGSFAGPVPGMVADVVDENCQPVRNQVGELIIRKPWIGMARGFWKDPQRYHETYWSRWPGIWQHGDFAAIDNDGLWFILGRSDDTIKIAGKRLGPAEAESVLVAHPAVTEAAAFGIPDDLKGQALVCLCILRPGIVADDTLRLDLKSRIITELGKPLAPKSIAFVSDLPRTRNGKIMRRVARAAYLNEPAGDLSALENPAAVEACRAAGIS